jgi:ureidoacrylate peracid hydrolase
LFPGLALLPHDLRIKQNKYSTFVPGVSDIDAQLKARAMDTLLIAGTARNVCRESTARYAMMLDYKVIMVSDSTAAFSAEEHASALNTFMVFFGDGMSTDEVMGRLTPLASREID